nr:unnamed protein product [Callosobruchus chinensis]
MCLQTLKALADNNIRIIFVWVPGHTGIRGNEAADIAAKSAAASPIVDVSEIKLTDQKRMCTNRMLEIWQHRWQNANTQLWQVKPSVAPWKPPLNLNREQRIATAVRKKLGYLFRARKYFSPSNLLTLYKAQIRPSLEYCSHIWGAAAPTTLSIFDAVQRRAIRLIDETPVLPYAPGDIESVVENERCRIYWNYSFPTLELVQANKPDIVLLDHQQKTMFVIEFSAPAEVNIVSKEEEKRTKYQALLGQLRRLWPDYAVSLLVMVIGSLGGMRNTLLSALRVIPVCRAAAHILAARMQKAVILGSLSLLRAHDTRTQ